MLVGIFFNLINNNNPFNVLLKEKTMNKDFNELEEKRFVDCYQAIQDAQKRMSPEWLMTIPGATL